MSESLASLRNLGPRSEAMLAGVGIHTVEELGVVGAVGAFILIGNGGQPVSLNLLWALEGALTGRDWREVARTDRLRLLNELEARGAHP